MEKTSVSALKEFLDRKGKGQEAKYTFTDRKGTSNVPIFKVVAEVDDLKTEGEGGSKQAAKHDAAEKMLQLLNINRPSSTLTTTTSPPINQKQEQTNYVGKLNELCSQYRMSAPIYDSIQKPDSGEFETFCNIKHSSLDIKSSGVGKTKQLSKHSAAKEMIKRLRLEQDVTDSTPSPPSKEKRPVIITPEYLKRIENKRPVQQTSLKDMSWENAHLALKIPGHPQSTTLNQLSEDQIQTIKDPYSTFLKIVHDDFHYRVTAKELPSANEDHVVTYLQVDCNFHWTFIGIGDNMAEARRNASLLGLGFLIKMNK